MDKICKTCGLVFPATSQYFQYRDKASGMLKPHCKMCTNKGDRYKKKVMREMSVKEKVCKYCGLTYPANLEHFSFKNTHKKILNDCCIGCEEDFLAQQKK